MRHLTLLAVLLLITGCNRTPVGFAPKATVAGKAAAPAPSQEGEEAAKRRFLDIAYKNVDDPTGLEVLSWGELTKNASREVKFRCKQIGVTPQTIDAITGNRFGGGAPVMVATAKLHYDGVRIASIHVPGIDRPWDVK